ncbi:MAG: sugar ABC transporter permease [Trueperaceae bacterium]|nr:sugar ABC transporter permease [Trueperaceae bacterium]
MRYPKHLPFLFIAPMLIGLFVFRIGPIFASFYVSFTEWNILGAPRFVGLANYRDAIETESFWHVMGNTVQFTLLYVPSVMALGLALALLVHQGLKGSLVFRGLFFMPYITSMVAVALVWRWIFASQHGLLNAFLRAIGIDDPPLWLGDPDYALIALVVVSVWQAAGFQMLLFLAGLQNVDGAIQDAAKVDGATRWQVFRHVTLPLLSPVTFFVLIVSLIASSQTFEATYALTGGGPQRSSTTLAFYIYQNAFVFFRMGYASALAYVLLTLVASIAALNFFLRRRWVHYG